ncbi:hypothetical protein [Halohasta salina]|uniref:hypothetical protein n=1 Tax=Halohasta salina TaxID=2961621 RepID=UPI0020A54419|nr:hypothetical protein [Halohasta salina]
MERIEFETVAFVLMAISLPLISLGSTGSASTLWTVGFAVLVVGTAIPPLMRYLESPASTA